MTEQELIQVYRFHEAEADKISDRLFGDFMAKVDMLIVAGDTLSMTNLVRSAPSVVIKAFCLDRIRQAGFPAINGNVHPRNYIAPETN